MLVSVTLRKAYRSLALATLALGFALCHPAFAQIEIAHIAGDGPFVLDTHGALFDVAYENNEARLTQLTDETGFVQIVPFGVLRKDGRVLTWAVDRTKFTLGHPSYTKPMLVSGVDHLTALAGYDGYFAGLTADGRVVEWGTPQTSTAANGPKSMPPHEVKGLPAIKSISTSRVTTLALAENGEIWGWGLEARGSLGVMPTHQYAEAPVRMAAPPSGTVKIIASSVHSYAVSADGHVTLWGNCPVTTTPSAPTNFTPTNIPSLSDSMDVVQNYADEWGPTFAIRKDGVVMAAYSNPLLMFHDEQACVSRFPTEMPPPRLVAEGMTTPALEAAFIGAEQQEDGVIAVGADHSLWAVLFEGRGSASKLVVHRLTIVHAH